jgi:hypothetical protein
VLPALEDIIDRGHAAEAEKVLRCFVEAAEKGLNDVDDSYGLIGPMAQDAVALRGKAWSRIEPRDPAQLARMVFDELQEDRYGLRDPMISDFAEALGRDGLLKLKELFQDQYEARRADPEMDEWKEREPLRHLADLADALGDVDLYIEVHRLEGLLDACALPVARRLLDAGRAEEALE